MKKTLDSIREYVTLRQDKTRQDKTRQDKEELQFNFSSSYKGGGRYLVISTTGGVL